MDCSGLWGYMDFSRLLGPAAGKNEQGDRRIELLRKKATQVPRRGLEILGIYIWSPTCVTLMAQLEQPYAELNKIKIFLVYAPVSTKIGPCFSALCEKKD